MGIYMLIYLYISLHHILKFSNILNNKMSPRNLPNKISIPNILLYSSSNHT